MTTYAARDLVRLPGLLSLSRLPLAIVFALMVDRPMWAVGVLLLSGVSDVLDGWVARRFGAGKVTTLLQYVVAVVALFHSRYVSALVLLAAACGAIATVVYWTREAGERRSSHPMSRAGR